MSDAFAALCQRYLGSAEVDDVFFAGALDVEGVGALKHLRRAHGFVTGALAASAGIQVGSILVEFDSQNPMCLLDLSSADGLKSGDSVKFQGKVRHLDQINGKLKLGRLIVEGCPSQEHRLLLRTRHTGGHHLVVGEQVFPVPNIPTDYYRLLPVAVGGFVLEPGVK